LGFVFQTLFTIFSGAILITFIIIIKSFLLLCLLMGVVLIGLLLLAVKRRSVKRVLVSISKRLIITYKTIWTFFSTETYKIEEYPVDPVVIK
jgi:uncharacterized membrane protein YraQ (UPF0718 family)